MLYQDPLETNLEPKDPDSGNEIDAELELDEDCPQKLNLTVTGQNKPNVNENAFTDGVWYIKENL